MTLPMRLLALGFVAASSSIAAIAPPASTDAAFDKFWSAHNPQEAAKAAQLVVSSGIGFDDAVARLKTGRTYSADVKRGMIRLQRRTSIGEFFYDVYIPPGYDPAHKYQLRFQLHGGVMMRETGEPRTAGGRGGRGGPLEGAEQIYVLPTSWRDAPWWGKAQLENLDAILDSVKRTYNVDENLVVLSGISDGATGLYYEAMRNTTPFASFLPLNGFLMVLANDRLYVDSDLYPTNLLNKPLFIVNGGQDPLYPMRLVEPYVDHLRASGVSVEYRPQPDAGHNTAWWPSVKDAFEGFVRNHPREPLPQAITWEASDRDTPARAHWLVIDRVASSAPAGKLSRPDLNVFSGPGFNRGRDLFARTRPFGRVEATRRGNEVQLATRGVGELTLLISPDAFDFSKPITVTANGRVVSDGRVEPSVATLMKWAARDNDRTMLFGAELRVAVR